MLDVSKIRIFLEISIEVILKILQSSVDVSSVFPTFAMPLWAHISKYGGMRQHLLLAAPWRQRGDNAQDRKPDLHAGEPSVHPTAELKQLPSAMYETSFGTVAHAQQQFRRLAVGPLRSHWLPFSSIHCVWSLVDLPSPVYLIPNNFLATL